MSKIKNYKKLYKSLLLQDTSEEDYESAISSIESRVEKIWNYICKAAGRNLIWWSFRNDVGSLDGKATTGGTFDPLKDFKFVKINGSYSLVKNPVYPYNNGFPTKLIWDKKWKSKIKKKSSKNLKFKKNDENINLMKDFFSYLKNHKKNN